MDVSFQNRKLLNTEVNTQTYVEFYLDCDDDILYSGKGVDRMLYINGKKDINTRIIKNMYYDVSGKNNKRCYFKMTDIIRNLLDSNYKMAVDIIRSQNETK